MAERQRHAFSPIILWDRTAQIKIHAHPEYLIAFVNERIDVKIRRFPHVDDLHDLSLRGLTKLAEEFYLELTGGIHGKAHHTDNGSVLRSETER